MSRRIRKDTGTKRGPYRHRSFESAENADMPQPIMDNPFDSDYLLDANFPEISDSFENDFAVRLEGDDLVELGNLPAEVFRLEVLDLVELGDLPRISQGVE